MNSVGPIRTVRKPKKLMKNFLFGPLPPLDCIDWYKLHHRSVTVTVHDTVLACHLTIMDTSHIWVSSNYSNTWQLVIIIYQQNLRTATWIEKCCRIILYRFWPNRIDQKGAQFLQNHFYWNNAIMTSFWTTLNDAAGYLLSVKKYSVIGHRPIFENC